MKKLLFVVLLLLPLSVSAEYLTTKAQIDTAVYHQLNIPIGGNDNIDTAVVTFAVNRAMQQLCFDAPALEKEDTIVGGTSSSSRYYSLNSDFVSLASITKLSGDSIVLPLDIYPNPSEAYKARGELTGDKVEYQRIDFPRQAWTFNDRLFLYPQSLFADTFIVNYYAVCSSLVLNASPVQIREGYRDAIVDYACYLLSMRGGQITKADGYFTAYLRKAGKVQVQ